MKNISRHVGTLEIVERLPNSINGNPRYLLRVDGVTFKTAVDSSYGYSVSNFEGKTVEVTVGTHYGTATLNTISLA